MALTFVSDRGDEVNKYSLSVGKGASFNGVTSEKGVTTYDGRGREFYPERGSMLRGTGQKAASLATS